MCEQKILHFFQNNLLKPDSIVVAVSGGCDSSALFHLLYTIREHVGNFRIGIAHVNHKLRLEESDEEAEFVKTLACTYNVQFHCKELRGKAFGDSGIEAWARKERYAFFQEIRTQYAYDYIATGHTADDVAETLLMKLSRGCGAQGISCIHEMRNDQVIRPLLQIRRHALRSWMNTKNFAWQEDSSNKDQRFLRNKLRISILPKFEEFYTDAVENVAAITIEFQYFQGVIERYIRLWIQEYVLEESEDYFLLKRPCNHALDFLSAEACAYLLRARKVDFDQKLIDRLIAAWKTRDQGIVLLKQKWRFVPYGYCVLITRRGIEKSSSFTHYQLLIPGKTLCVDFNIEFTIALEALNETEKLLFDPANWRVFFDAEEVGSSLLVTSINQYHRFHPLGSLHEMRLVEFLKKKKVPAVIREKIAVVSNTDGLVVWVPGIAISQKVRITSRCKKVLKVVCRRLSELSEKK